MTSSKLPLLRIRTPCSSSGLSSVLSSDSPDSDSDRERNTALVETALDDNGEHVPENKLMVIYHIYNDLSAHTHTHTHTQWKLDFRIFVLKVCKPIYCHKNKHAINNP